MVLGGCWYKVRDDSRGGQLIRWHNSHKKTCVESDKKKDREMVFFREEDFFGKLGFKSLALDLGYRRRGGGSFVNGGKGGNREVFWRWCSEPL